ncbi:MAG: hypothetical protein Crog4KO_20930 [Crocinitomicaceae bacterium]
MPRKPNIHDIERLVDKFKFERYIYLILIALCALIIMIVAVVAFTQGNWETGLSLLAPGGAIFFCLSRVFKMWDDIMKALFHKTDNPEEDE